MENPAYDIGRMVKGEAVLLEKSTPIDARDQIKRFLEEKVVLANLSGHRLYYYSVRLRKSLELLGRDFLNPPEDRLRDFIKQLINKVSERTVTDYLYTYKRFQKWYHKGKLPARFEILKFKAKKTGKRPEDLITPDEFQRMIDNAGSVRNQALISILYDSGCRIGEILGMRKKDVVFDEYGMILAVSGKTGYRKVYVVGVSVMFVKKWLQLHPSHDQDSALFCLVSESQTRKHTVGDPMTYPDVRMTLQRTLKKAGISKRIHPHLFRHTKASMLATQLTEAPLEAQMGWVHGSKQTRTYVHLTGEQQRAAVLRAYGLTTQEKALATDTKACPSCGNVISIRADYCPFCYTDFPARGIQTAAQARDSFLAEIEKLRVEIGQLREGKIRLTKGEQEEILRDHRLGFPNIDKEFLHDMFEKDIEQIIRKVVQSKLEDKK